MLHQLLGSKTAERILLFLLVNETTYATQLHRLFQTALTPLQKGLMRLEQAGVLTSSYQGKTRFYRFNEEYPLLAELEHLLKKSYTLLTPRERGSYYFIRYAPCERRANQELLLQLWEQLRSVRRVLFHFRSRGGDQGRGEGEVLVEREPRLAQAIFRERGSWEGKAGQRFNFTNTFRWTLNRIDGMLTLEHLRFGPRHPVFLFHLAPTSEEYLESLHPHLCGEDTYFGQVERQHDKISLTWRILGPRKNEEVKYIYI